MAVTIADNVLHNIDGNERNKLATFQENPGYGGQRINVRIGHDAMTVAHVTFGAGSRHVSIFYNRVGEEFQIVGVGQHDGKKGGKTIYSCLWQNRGGTRVTVAIQ